MPDDIPPRILKATAELLSAEGVSEVDIIQGLNQIRNEKMLHRFAKGVFDQYIELIVGVKLGCIKSSEKDLYFSKKALKAACYEIETDLCVMLARRKDLVGKDEETNYPKLARGKIAGITTFRLARASIIQMSRTCVSCWDTEKNKPKCDITTINTSFAIKCGLHFIGKKYTEIPEEVRKELIYTLEKRHTNQETLGVVFDTIKTLI